jgi:hypothetical protein
MFSNLKVEAGPRASGSHVGRRRRDASLEELLHAGVDSDQVILLEAELLRTSPGVHPALVAGLSRIEENAIKNASMLGDIRRRLTQQELHEEV